MKLRTSKTEIWINISYNGAEAKFLVSPATPKEDADILNHCYVTKWERNQRFTEPDIYLFKISKIDKVIIDWQGVEDDDGQPIDCTRKNKELVYLFNSELIDMVLDEATKISEDMAKQQELERKN